MIPKECKRLAAVDFPIAEVSKHAVREKSTRHDILPGGADGAADLKQPRVKADTDARYESALGGQQKTEPMQVRETPPTYGGEE